MQKQDVWEGCVRVFARLLPADPDLWHCSPQSCQGKFGGMAENWLCPESQMDECEKTCSNNNKRRPSLTSEENRTGKLPEVIEFM